MTAEINELFEEGITRCRELSDEAVEAMTAIDRMAQDSETLTQRVETEGAEAVRHMRDLSQRLEKAETDLESSRSQAQSALASLGGAAGELAAGFADLLTRVRKSLGALESRRDELGHSLEAQMSGTQEAFAQLVDGTAEEQSHAEERLDEVAQALRGLRAAIDTARAEFAQKQQDWAAKADEMEATVHEQTASWMAGLGDLLSRQAQCMVDAANAMVDQHNDAMEGLRHRFIEEAPRELATALEPIEDALVQLGVAATDRQERLSSAAEEHERWAGNALPTVGRIQETLHTAAQLG